MVLLAKIMGGKNQLTFFSRPNTRSKSFEKLARQSKACPEFATRPGRPPRKRRAKHAQPGISQSRADHDERESGLLVHYI